MGKGNNVLHASYNHVNFTSCRHNPINYRIKRQINNSIVLKLFNPTPVGGGSFLPPYRKMAITPKNNDPKEPKLCDFSYISMTNPPIPF